MSVELAFSVGPVQAFVAQARRTRDFWGGSYLLSFLTAHAIRGALIAGAQISPEQLTNDLLVRWVCGDQEGEPPSIGSVPNHFEAAATDVDQAHQVARAAEAALHEAWQRASEAVWKRFIVPAQSHTTEARRIWDRQVRSFWEIVWVVGENAPELLARRKSWRTHWPPDEPGDKCSVMPAYQELSGFIRARDRESQDAFWRQIRQRTGDLDLAEGERLCAVALVKRLYARCAQEAIGWQVETSAWPSTVDFAALPWVQRVSSNPEACAKAREYAELVMQHAPLEAREGARHFPAVVSCGDFTRLNGDYQHPTFLANRGLTRLRDESQRQKLQEALTAVTKVADSSGQIGSPPVYYAVLRADGDRLGTLIKKGGAEVKRRVATALDHFTKEAAALSEEHNAVRVYAGGDDVLAMLPVTSALPYADALASMYTECFGRESVPQATLSAAVLFAHMTAPLSRVLAEVRRLLDDVAKDQNGRDSLAVGVYRRSGPALEWMTTWDRENGRGVEILQQLIERLKPEADREVSSGIVYRVHGILWRLFGTEPWRPGACLKPIVDVDVDKLVQAEIAHSLEKRGGRDVDTRQRVEDAATVICDLLPIARGGPMPSSPGHISTEALLLARFLAGGGHEEEHL